MNERSDDAELNRWYRATGHTHAVLLRWFRSVGYARCGGVSVDLHEPCALPGNDIEYLPGVHMRIDGRDMTPAEQGLARRLLEQMASDARDALCGHSTLAVIVPAAEPEAEPQPKNEPRTE